MKSSRRFQNFARFSSAVPENGLSSKALSSAIVLRLICCTATCSHVLFRRQDYPVVAVVEALYYLPADRLDLAVVKLGM